MCSEDIINMFNFVFFNSFNSAVLKKGTEICFRKLLQFLQHFPTLRQKTCSTMPCFGGALGLKTLAESKLAGESLKKASTQLAW